MNHIYLIILSVLSLILSFLQNYFNLYLLNNDIILFIFGYLTGNVIYYIWMGK